MNHFIEGIMDLVVKGGGLSTAFEFIHCGHPRLRSECNIRYPLYYLIAILHQDVRKDEFQKKTHRRLARRLYRSMNTPA